VKEAKFLNKMNERNEIRKQLKSAFNKIDCQYLPCPVSDGTNDMNLEEALQNMENIEWSQLRQPFRIELTNLLNNIRDQIKPKIINSTAVNGRLFATYIKEIVNKLNLNENIYINDTFNSCIKKVALETLEMVNLEYNNEMKKLVYPLDWNKFNDFENNLNDKCKQILSSSIIGNKQTLNITLVNFSKFKQNLLEQLKEKNREAINIENNRILEQKLKALSISKEKEILKNAETRIQVACLERRIKELEEKYKKDKDRDSEAEEKYRRIKADNQNRELLEKSRRIKAENQNRELLEKFQRIQIERIRNKEIEEKCQEIKVEIEIEKRKLKEKCLRPRCKDGTLDMRYKCNRGLDKFKD
jgi:hypothetical protein